MGWFGRLDDEELQKRLRRRYAENAAKETTRKTMRDELESYLNKEIAKLCQSQGVSLFNKFNFDDVAERKERWRQYLHNGNTDSVSPLFLEDYTAEDRWECLIYKSGETASLKPFTQHLGQQFEQKIIPILQTQQNKMTRELEYIAILLNEITMLHKQLIASE